MVTCLVGVYQAIQIFLIQQTANCSINDYYHFCFVYSCFVDKLTKLAYCASFSMYSTLTKSANHLCYFLPNVILRLKMVIQGLTLSNILNDTGFRVALLLLFLVFRLCPLRGRHHLIRATTWHRFFRWTPFLTRPSHYIRAWDRQCIAEAWVWALSGN